MANIQDIEGINDILEEKLRAAGVKTVEGLLEQGGTTSGRQALAKATGIDGKSLLRFVNHADLYRVKGVGAQFAELLEAAGVDTVAELAQRRPDNLHAKLVEVGADKNLTNRIPSAEMVKDFVEQAKALPRMVSH